MINKKNFVGHYKLRFNAPLIVAFLSMFIIWKHKSFSLINMMAFIVTIVGLAIWFAGLFAIKDSFSLNAKAHTLITSGIYSKISHPIYTGAVLVFVGWCILLQSAWIYAFTALLLILEIIRANNENKILAQKFGDKYERYKATTWI